MGKVILTYDLLYMKYKILQVNTTSNWGSTGHIVEEIGKACLNQGWESYIAYGRHSHKSRSVIIKIGNPISLILHVLCTRFFDMHGLLSQWATYNLIKKVKKIKPNLIHLHNLHGYYLNYPLLFDFLSKQQIPIVWTLHDCWPFTGHCSHYSVANCFRWKSKCYSCPLLRKYPKSCFMDRAEKNFEIKKKFFTSVPEMTIVTVSNWLARQVQESFLKGYTIETIYNGIDTDVFSPLQVDKNKYGVEGKFVVLGVANIWTPSKGLCDFIKLREILPDNFVIILIGLSLRQIASLPQGIMGITRTNNQKELVEYYSMADVYVNTSVEETLGMTSVESLSCGTPVITYNATACPEVVDETCGYVVVPHDIDSVKRYIFNICSIGKSEYKERCRSRAVNIFNKTGRYLEYVQLYRKLLNIE